VCATRCKSLVPSEQALHSQCEPVLPVPATRSPKLDTMAPLGLRSLPSVRTKSAVCQRRNIAGARSQHSGAHVVVLVVLRAEMQRSNALVLPSSSQKLASAAVWLVCGLLELPAQSSSVAILSLWPPASAGYE
jgi:hypothetical protein